ncbi:DUF763 domain-containing protein [Candidatus Bathyarchaeota archaeon]|nr:MAG: DUF763 domain-containing protein [Candidatus Bathyarchaeota archaeon]
MRRTGIADLPLHRGGVPRWLMRRMVRLADAIAVLLVEEHGPGEFVRRLSDPFWFQALGCVLGFDWHSSGITTVVTAVLREALRPDEHGLAVCGGKGKRSLATPEDIDRAVEELGLPGRAREELKYASRMCAKVDNAALQDGYTLYHHALFLSEDGSWAVVQQGMCVADGTARRYHWFSEALERGFVVEPHTGIGSDVLRPAVLDMTAEASEGCRRASLDLVKEGPRRIKRLLRSLRPEWQKTLCDWMPVPEPGGGQVALRYLRMPLNANWEALARAYELQPGDYEELLALRGIGPATVRALALIADLVYGEEPSWEDPARFSFAFGGKDGVPYPVNRALMDEAISMLEEAIEGARLGEEHRLKDLRCLRALLPRGWRT